MAVRPDPERLGVWRDFLEAHAAIEAELERELQEQRQLPLAWYDVLVQLQEAGGRRRMQELAGVLLVHKSSLTRLVDRMEAAGLVTRVRCEDDARGMWAELTREGKEVLRHAAPAHLRGVQRHFAAHLTDTDVTSLQRVLSKLLAANGRS